MSTSKTVLMVVLCCLISSLTGAVAGFYAAVKTPSVSNIAVLDIDALAASIDPNDRNYAPKAQELSDRTKEVTDQLTAAGMVVLDRAHVVSAPEEAIIHVDYPAK